MRGLRGRCCGLIAVALMTAEFAVAPGAALGADWPPPRQVEAVFFRLTPNESVIEAFRVTAADTSYRDAESPSPVNAGPLCLRVEREQCALAWGNERILLTDVADPSQTIEVLALNGPRRWRRRLAELSVDHVEVVVRGQRGEYVAASGATGNAQFLQWEEPLGVNVILTARGERFGEGDLLTLAEALVVAPVTRDAVIPASRVAGDPPPD